jgi:hypothetical protein
MRGGEEIISRSPISWVTASLLTLYLHSLWSCFCEQKELYASVMLSGPRASFCFDLQVMCVCVCVSVCVCVCVCVLLCVCVYLQCHLAIKKPKSVL